MATWLAEFASAAGIAVVEAVLADYYDSASQQRQAEIDAISDRMAEHNFVIPDTPVYTDSDTVFYGVTHRDRINCCAAFYASNGAISLLEGPALMGIALSGINFGGADGLSVADVFVPIEQVRADMSDFRKGIDPSSVYQTKAGQLEIGYRSDYPEASTGTVSVVATRENGGVLFGGDHDLTYQA